MITKDNSPVYYFQLNNILTRLTKPTAKWISTFHQVNHRKGKRMYRKRDSTNDTFTYTFCEVLYNVKYRTECIVLKETSCYVTLAVLQMDLGTNQSQANLSDYFSRHRWKC